MNVEESPLPGLEALPRERLPERDLWVGIAARIQPVPVVRRRPTAWPYALAASVCVGLVTAALLRSPVADHAVSSAPVEVAGASDVVSTQSRYGSGDDSARAPAISARSLRTLRSESLDNAPALTAQRAEASGLMKAKLSGGERAHSQRALLRANLKLVTQAEREVRRALQQDPESETLHSLLAAAESKRELLTAMLIHEQD